MRGSIVWLMLVFLFPAGAQDKGESFSLGVSHSEAWERYGSPTSYYIHRQYFKTDPHFTHGLLWEVYERNSKGITYEARLLYKIDPTTSRQHPTTRIEEIRFVFNRPLSARAALKLVPEIEAICAKGCEVRSSSVPGEQNLTVRTRDAKDGNPAIALAWITADGVTEHPVKDLDDKVTQLQIFERSLSDDGSVNGSSSLRGVWPEN